MYVTSIQVIMVIIIMFLLSNYNVVIFREDIGIKEPDLNLRFNVVLNIDIKYYLSIPLSYDVSF